MFNNDQDIVQNELLHGEDSDGTRTSEMPEKGT